MEDERCYRIASSRDGRFDGTFVTAVLTTGIYCRPSCPAVTPRRQNVRFYPTPAAAQEAGFRACKRCRPDAAPGSPEWDARADVVARAVRLIGDGVVERDGVDGLSRRLGYSPRHVHRLLQAELGTGPLRLAMAQRVQSARALLESTDIRVTDVAWAAGFASIRQFNDQIRTTYALTPTAIRSRAGRRRPPAGGERRAVAVTAHLAYRPPLDLDGLLGFLGRRAVPGVELFDGECYSAVLRLPRGTGTVAVRASGDGRPAVDCTLRLDDVRDHAAAVFRLRRLLDLDADPVAVAEVLGDDPLLRGAVATRPGLRMPGCTDPHELAMRAVIGQGVSVAAARVAAGRIAERYGQPLDEPSGDLRFAFPTPEAIAGADPADLPLPRRRAAALRSLAAALAGGRIALDPGADRDQAERELLALPGIGSWTAAYVRMRGLGDPDVFPPGDAGLERATGAGAAAPEAWKPWRSYAVAHLWASLGSHSSQKESR